MPERLYLEEYLQNPNHYTMKAWYLTDVKHYEDVLKDDIDIQWNNFCKEKGLNPLDEEMNKTEFDTFFDNALENDLWLIVHGDEPIYADVAYKSLFYITLFQAMEFTQDDLHVLVDKVVINKYNLFIRYIKLARRIDLFPLQQPSHALEYFNEMDEDSQDALQYDY